MLSAHADVPTTAQEMKKGAVNFLTKPVEFIELDAVLEKAIRIRDLRLGHKHLKETIGGLQASEDLIVALLGHNLQGEVRLSRELQQPLVIA